MIVKPDYLVALQVPPWVTKDMIQGATKALVYVIDELQRSKDPEAALRGFLDAAKLDGYPVNVAFVGQGAEANKKLTELCVRAYWWKFEQIATKEGPKK